jgi:A/G-specific adenine glycosylase
MTDRTGSGLPDPSLAPELLRWYREQTEAAGASGVGARRVAGRGESDAYRVWVAEVMAQQTRMATVRPYYDLFVRRFPDVHALAAAHIDEVMKAWAGLGYYARARNLHRAAREVVESYAGKIPEDRERLRSLPGVGPYTAGAIASIAFGRPEPAIDGNARRVLARVCDLARPPARVLEGAALRLIEAVPGRAGELNQALMDLGNGVCVPRAPRCGSCPMAGGCLALARGTIAERPARRPQRSLPHHHLAVGLIRSRGWLLIARRPEEGLLGGLWEFPGGKIGAGETPQAAVRREVREEMGIEVEVGGLVAQVDHAYSHFRITLHAYWAELVAGRPRPTAATAWCWVRPSRLGEFAFPAANQRIIGALGGASEPPAGT